MARPVKNRRVSCMPTVNYFKPAGIPMGALEEVRLSVEEAEAIRLKDLENMEQEEGAEKMNISRPTFQRVLSSARHKIANALLNGKAIRIEGGVFEMSFKRFRCRAGHEWDLQTPFPENPVVCPTCSEPEIHAVNTAAPGRRKGCGRKGYGRDIIQ